MEPHTARTEENALKSVINGEKVSRFLFTVTQPKRLDAAKTVQTNYPPGGVASYCRNTKTGVLAV
jgi:hypothetical protein